MAKQFKGFTVYQRKIPGKANSHYIKSSIYCDKCNGAIPGIKPVSTGPDGEFTRIQKFVPDDRRAKPAGKGKHAWYCGSCNTSPAEDTPPMAEETPPTEDQTPEVTEEICSYCGKLEHWRADCPNALALVEGAEKGTEEPVEDKVEAEVSAEPEIPSCEMTTLIQGNAELVQQQEELLKKVEQLTAHLEAVMVENKALQALVATLEQKMSQDATPLLIGAPHYELEKMAMDPAFSDKMYRGASWMLIRAMITQRRI